MLLMQMASLLLSSTMNNAQTLSSEVKFFKVPIALPPLLGRGYCADTEKFDTGPLIHQIKKKKHVYMHS